MTNEKIKRYRFYIGWDNKTHKREIKKAFNIISNNKVLGFSKIDALGFWDKTKENSFIIEVLASKDNPLTDDNAIRIKNELTTGLKQYLVLLTMENLSLLS